MLRATPYVCLAATLLLAAAGSPALALITGGDSSIGRSVAILFAREGADVAVAYLNEHRDAEETKYAVEAEGRRCITLSGDVADPKFCQAAVKATVRCCCANPLVRGSRKMRPSKSPLVSPVAMVIDSSAESPGAKLIRRGETVMDVPGCPASVLTS